MASEPFPASVRRGSAVLVHGLWSCPADWRWVISRLSDSGVHLAVPDLPTHRSATAGLADDADEVRQAIRSSPAPVIVVGASYGGTVIGVAAANEADVTRLVYLGDVPLQASDNERDASWVHSDSHVLLLVDGTCVLNDDWWLIQASSVFTPEIVEHLRRHPRRPAALGAVSDPVPAAAWQSIPTTVLLGRNDDLISAEEREWVTTHVPDVRPLDCDHFIQFREPQAVVDIVLEAL